MPLLSRMGPPEPGQPLHTVAVIGALAGVVAILVFLVVGSGVLPQRAPGVVQATEIEIAPEISGRAARITVQTGQKVHRGEELALLTNPELEAALTFAKAELSAAQAARDHVYAGVRIEQVNALQRQIEAAKADLVYAQQQLARKTQLAATAVASRQDLDQATAAVANARAKVADAQAAYLAASLGPTREEIAIADAKVEDAEAAVAVIAARVAKLQIQAPVDGIVAVLVAEPGESIIPGQPVMSLEAAGGHWASFNMREDQFGDLHIGSRVELQPANSNDRIAARIAEIIPRGEFATWRAARAVGDHDLNAFVLRADPVGPASETLQPGMSVWLQPAGRTAD